MSIGPRGVLATLVTLVLLAAVYFAVSQKGANSSKTEATSATPSPPSIAGDRSDDRRTGEMDSSREGSTLGERYERSNDLHELTLEMSTLSDRGDGQASRLIAKAYEECWLFAINPAGFEQDMKQHAQLRPDLAKPLEIVLHRTIRRCRGFAGASIGPNAITAILKKAAGQGDLAAEVQLLTLGPATERVNFDAASQKELAERVLLSRDADAFAAMAVLMGPGSNGRQQTLAPLPAGSYLAEAAWQLASCRLGRDCSPDSSAVAIMCFGGGVNCRLRSLEQFYLQEVLPPADRDKLWQQVDALTQGKRKL